MVKNFLKKNEMKRVDFKLMIVEEGSMVQQNLMVHFFFQPIMHLSLWSLWSLCAYFFWAIKGCMGQLVKWKRIQKHTLHVNFPLSTSRTMNSETSSSFHAHYHHCIGSYLFFFFSPLCFLRVNFPLPRESNF